MTIETARARETQMFLNEVRDTKAKMQKACEKINKIFGLNVSVDLMPEYKIIEEVENNDNKQADRTGSDE